MIHACSPARWRGEPRAGGPRHALVCTATTAAFAAGQLHAGVLTAFQSLLRRHPGIGEAIESEGRFPSWEAVGTLDSSAGSDLQHLLQCRRLADLLSAEDDRVCRAILTFVGWQRLNTDSQWRKARSNDPDPPPHPGGGELLTGWVHGLLEPDAPAAEDDPRQHLHELAACAFVPLALPGSLAARLAEQRLARDGAAGTPQLADALAGDPMARDAIRGLVGGIPVGDRLLDALLVAALNPPLCNTLLGADDTMPNWDGLQPGRRFRRLCAVREQLAGLDDNANESEVEAWIDAACGHLGWPLHTPSLQRAQQARDEVTGTPGLAAAARWLANHQRRDQLVAPEPPPATAACIQYVAFLDAFIASRGGLVQPAVLPAIPGCSPLAPVNGATLPLPQQAMLVQTAAVGVVEDLIDGKTLRDAAARVLAMLQGAEWPEAADMVAATLRLTALPTV